MTIERELLDLERSYWQAIQEKDVETVMRLTDDSCILAGAQGVGRVQRDELPALMESASYQLNEFQLGDEVEVQMIGDDVAVLAYEIHERLTVDGRELTIDAADASTWVRRDGRWLCALHTEALAGDPYGRDRRPRSID